MAVLIRCSKPKCAKLLRVSDELLENGAVCTKCGTILVRPIAVEHNKDLRKASVATEPQGNDAATDKSKSNRQERISPPNRWTFSRLAGIIGIPITVAAVIISYWSWQEARESRRIAEASFDRTVGKRTAKFKVLGVHPGEEQTKNPFRYRRVPIGNNGIPLESGAKNMLQFNSLEELLNLNIRLVVQNDGDEVIEAFRIETIFEFAWINYRDGEKKWKPIKNLLRQTERDDHQLTTKLKPGRVASIPVSRPLLLHMMDVQETTDPGEGSKDYRGLFYVTCYARGVGLPSFDHARSNTGAFADVIWIRDGFSEERCKRTLSTFQDNVELPFEVETITKLIPLPEGIFRLGRILRGVDGRPRCWCHEGAADVATVRFLSHEDFADLDK